MEGEKLIDEERASSKGSVYSSLESLEEHKDVKQYTPILRQRCDWRLIMVEVFIFVTIFSLSLIVIGTGSVLIEDNNSQTEVSFPASRFVLASESHFNVSVENVKDKYNALNYTVIPFNFGGNSEHLSIVFKLSLQDHELKNKSYVIKNGTCNLPPALKELDATCFIMRYWPRNLTQAGNISCNVSSAFIVWKWASFDDNNSTEYNFSDVYNKINCSEASKKPDYWIECDNQQKDIKRILDDKNTDSDFIIMSFCSKNNNHLAVSYSVSFTEEWQVYTYPYNQYTINITSPKDSRSVLVPLISDENFINIEINSEDIQPIILHQEGELNASRVETFIKKKMRIKTQDAAIIIVAMTIPILIMSVIQVIRGLWQPIMMILTEKKLCPSFAAHS